MTKIVLLNAPPGAGKDTAAAYVQGQVANAEIVKFAAPLKATAIALYCNGDSQKFYAFDTDQKKKVTPDKQFLGKTCRQVQIDISEEYMKPMHGEQVFGKFLANVINQKEASGTEVFLVSDSGFRPEAEVLVEEFGPQNVLLVRVHREGFTYDGDSRSYIDLADLDVKCIDFENVTGQFNESMAELLIEVNKFIKGE